MSESRPPLSVIPRQALVLCLLAAAVAAFAVETAQAQEGAGGGEQYVDLAVIHFDQAKSTSNYIATSVWFENRGTATAYDVEVVILARGNAGENLDIDLHDSQVSHFDETTGTLRVPRMEPGTVVSFPFQVVDTATNPPSDKMVGLSAEISSQVSYESPARMHDNVARVWHVFANTSVPQVEPHYSVTVTMEEYPLETDRLNLFVTARIPQVGATDQALNDARINVELPPGLEVDPNGSATFTGTSARYDGALKKRV